MMQLLQIRGAVKEESEEDDNSIMETSLTYIPAGDDTPGIKILGELDLVKSEESEEVSPFEKHSLF